MEDFILSQDELHSDTPYYVSALLERGIHVLIYAGELDWICNHLGNERWTMKLEWSGQGEFVKQPLREWSIDSDSEVEGNSALLKSKRAGKTRSWGKLTFATIEGAGHMVCSFFFPFFSADAATTFLLW
jgi:carboxypeptidase C (cathepsin A)